MNKSKEVIGRRAELETLEDCFNSPKAEFLALYGRRRVGKTFLIREVFGQNFLFYATGVLGGDTAAQLAHFNEEIARAGGRNLPVATDWHQAFSNLNHILETSKRTGKKVIFLDEVPWLSTPKSGFLAALDYFWNRHASARKDVLLIICGSAASWIIDNVVNDTGGLHNRLTRQIRLQPFCLKECEAYFKAMGIDIPRYQIAEAYMIFGGIPYYLSLFRPRYSLAQNVDGIYFGEGAPLGNEYPNLYRSLFRNPEGHMHIIEALAGKNAGQTRSEICLVSGCTHGGGLTKVLKELESSGFLREYQAFDKKQRDRIYQLIDPFTLFCLRFSEKRSLYSSDFWLRFSTTPAHSAWAGYAFEMLCMLHLPQIRRALGISGVLTEVSSWKSKASDPGAQIDLVIDRADRVINLCEMKYASAPYAIDKKTDMSLRNKRAAFLEETHTRKAAHITMVTPYGLKKNAYEAGIPFQITLDDLFE
ncbi:MAG: ATP-binding protein [Lachnospiraceae bacterium]|jgi:hypothetical protein|nr:ATP-binding protein [Lachnospiraceae bacterium]